jgi:hypothetical protein
MFAAPQRIHYFPSRGEERGLVLEVDLQKKAKLVELTRGRQ